MLFDWLEIHTIHSQLLAASLVQSVHDPKLRHVLPGHGVTVLRRMNRIADIERSVHALLGLRWLP